MDRVTEEEMAIALGKLGALGVVHRNCSIEVQVKIVTTIKRPVFRSEPRAAPSPPTAQRPSTQRDATWSSLIAHTDTI